jgi:hypothetical protein
MQFWNDRSSAVVNTRGDSRILHVSSIWVRQGFGEHRVDSLAHIHRLLIRTCTVRWTLLEQVCPTQRRFAPPTRILPAVACIGGTD